jgi:hypothetical protein
MKWGKKKIQNLSLEEEPVKGTEYLPVKREKTEEYVVPLKKAKTLFEGQSDHHCQMS